MSPRENQGAEVETGAFCHRLVGGGVFPQSGSPLPTGEQEGVTHTTCPPGRTGSGQ